MNGTVQWTVNGRQAGPKNSDQILRIPESGPLKFLNTWLIECWSKDSGNKLFRSIWNFVIGREFYVSSRLKIFIPFVRGPGYRIKSIRLRNSTFACVTSTCKQLGFFQKSNELETSLSPSDRNEFRHGQTFFENIIVSCWHIYWCCLCCWLHFSIWTSCHNKRHFWIRLLNFQT